MQSPDEWDELLALRGDLRGETTLVPCQTCGTDLPFREAHMYRGEEALKWAFAAQAEELPELPEQVTVGAFYCETCWKAKFGDRIDAVTRGDASDDAAGPK